MSEGFLVTGSMYQKNGWVQEKGRARCSAECLQAIWWLMQHLHQQAFQFSYGANIWRQPKVPAVVWHLDHRITREWWRAVGFLEGLSCKLAFSFRHGLFRNGLCYWTIGRRYSHCEFTVKPDGKGNNPVIWLANQIKFEQNLRINTQFVHTESSILDPQEWDSHCENCSAEAVSFVVFA